MKINSNFDNLVPNYLFAEVAKRTNDFISNNPDKKVIKLGIGDVTLPLPPVAVEAMKQGAEELGKKETFKGYPDYEGYEFVRKAVSDYYKSYGVSVAPEEILINDGAKSDSGNIGDIFSKDNTVLVTDPVYPVYVDSNIMAGRKIIYADSNQQNGFAAMPDNSVKADIIYLCSPNNPTGSAYTYDALKAWVDYANANDAIIIYDAAYEAFITEDNCPRSIFAIDGARTCAIELCSLSKTATSISCGTAVRLPSSTAFRGLSREPRLLFSARKVSVRLKKILPTIRKMPALSLLQWTSSAFTTQAARIRPTSGSSARTVWAAGSSLTSCLRRLT